MNDFKKFIEISIQNPYTINDFSTKQDVIKWMLWQAELRNLTGQVKKTFDNFDLDDKEQTIESWYKTACEALFEWGIENVK